MTRRQARELSIVIVMLGLAVVAVSSVRRYLGSSHQRVREQHDVYFLPPPEHVVTLSLGYKAAVADILWAHVLVSQGLHLFERRRFENLTRLYDAINELDPTWRTPYLMADGLFTLQPTAVRFEEVLKTRAVLERGTRHRPLDGEMWLNLGQFVSYIAPASYLEARPEMADRWRREGTKFLERAAELGAGDSAIGWQALGGATILEKEGERDASIRFLKRAYAATEDPQLRKDIESRLQRLLGEEELERSLARHRAFDRLREAEMPWLHPGAILALGPEPRPAACAGPGHEDEAECATTWRAWAERFEPVSQ